MIKKSITRQSSGQFGATASLHPKLPLTFPMGSINFYGDEMDLKKFIGAVVAVFITTQITDGIIHNFILGKDYTALQHVWRPDMMSKMWIMIINSLMFSILFVYIFSKGYENKGPIEGIRYGILTGLFVYIFSAVNQYVVYPISFSLLIKWCIYGVLQFIMYGTITALIFEQRTNP